MTTVYKNDHYRLTIDTDNDPENYDYGYGYTLEKREKCHCCNHVAYDEIDSCWGIYADSENDAINVIKDMLPTDAEGVIDPSNITHDE